MSRYLQSALALSVVVGLAGSVRAGYDTPTPASPDPVLTTADTMQYTGGALSISIQDMNITSSSAQPLPPSGPFVANSFFDVFFDISVNGSPSQPGHATGPVQIVSSGPGGAAGYFDTEMLAMDLQGTTPFGPVMIRESPTKQSLGRTAIIPAGGGLYHIDSFFDVFTELSVDGGQTWMPGTSSGVGGSAHFVGTDVPEPASLALLGVGMACMAVRRRRV